MTERERLQQAIAHLEAQRAVLGDAVVESALAALRRQLEEAPTALPQRKQATVLFSDVSGFTALAGTMDPEDVTNLMNALWQRLDGIVVAHGGAVDKHMGDAVMALWGAADAREDDPEQAVRAALAMQESLASFRQERRLRLAMRTAVNTGLVLLGAVGTTHEFTAMGDTVNLASRLQHAAPADGVIVSADTYRHIRGLFELEPLEPLQVKGKDEPVQAYLVLRPRPRVFWTETRGIRGVKTRLIGRQAELARLQEAFSRLTTGSAGQLVIVLGEAGIGKSRLLYEFVQWMAPWADKVYLLQGRAGEGMQVRPYSLLRDLMTTHLQIQDEDPREVVWDKMEKGIAQACGPMSQVKAHLIGQLLGFDFLTSPHLQGIAQEAKQIRERALVYLGDYMRALVAQRPVVILLDDLHWADDSSLEAVERLLREATAPARPAGGRGTFPLLVVCAARPDFTERRPQWGEELNAGRLELQPLSNADSQALVDEILQHAVEVPAALRQVVVGRAEGNPFYVEEVIKMLIEEGVIVLGEGHWHVQVATLGQLRLPPTLAAVLQARFDRLPAAEQAVLQQASVFGRTFWADGVAFLNDPRQGRDPAPTLAALRSLQGREMVFQRERSALAGSAEFIFKHVLLRESVYEGVLKSERRIYHRRAADWLIAHGGERVGEFAGMIADHLEQAGEIEQAAALMRQAGEQASQVSALAEARSFFERALALLPAENPERAQLMIRSGSVDAAIGNNESARQRLEEGLALARAHGDDYQSAVALLQLGSVAMSEGDRARAWEQTQEGAALAERAGDPSLLSRARADLGWLEIRAGHYPEAKACFGESLAIARSLASAGGDGLKSRRSQVHPLNGLGFACTMLAEYEEAEGHYRACVELCQALGDRSGAAAALANLGESLWLQGNYAPAERCMQESLAVFEEIDRRQSVTMIRGNLGHLSVSQGNYGAAVQYYRQALASAVEIKVTPVVLDILSGLAQVLARTGQLDRSLDLVGLAMHHPALHEQSRPMLEKLLAEIKGQLPERVVEAGLARGQKLDLDQVAREVLEISWFGPQRRERNP